MIIILTIFLIVLVTTFSIRSWLYLIIERYKKGNIVLVYDNDFIELFETMNWVEPPNCYQNVVVSYMEICMIDAHEISIKKDSWFITNVLYTNHTLSLIKDPFYYYKVVRYLKSRPPLNDADKLTLKRDQIIDSIL